MKKNWNLWQGFSDITWSTIKQYWLTFWNMTAERNGFFIFEEVPTPTMRDFAINKRRLRSRISREVQLNESGRSSKREHIILREQAKTTKTLQFTWRNKTSKSEILDEESNNYGASVLVYTGSLGLSVRIEALCQVHVSLLHNTCSIFSSWKHQAMSKGDQKSSYLSGKVMDHILFSDSTDFYEMTLLKFPFKIQQR